MNEVQEFILRRAMQKIANDQNKKVPFKYAAERISAYDSQQPNDRIFKHHTPGARYINVLDDYKIFDTLNDNDSTALPKLRESQARFQAERLGTIPGSDEFNTLVKYLIEQGETNWYNFNNPKAPKPNVKVPHFKHDNGVDMKELNNDQERIRKAGRTMVDLDNYKKFSGNA